MPVRRAVPGLETRRRPSIRAASVLYHGAYATMDRTRRGLDAWIAAAGLTRGSPSRIVYLQFGAESELRVPTPLVVVRAADLLTELHVPLA